MGWRPIGGGKVVKKVEAEEWGRGWWREGKEKRVGPDKGVNIGEMDDGVVCGALLGLLSSPRIVRKPPRDSSSGSVGFSFARTPISTLIEPSRFSIRSFHTPEFGGA